MYTRTVLHTRVLDSISWWVFRIIPGDIIWGFIWWNHGGLVGWFLPSRRPQPLPRQILLSEDNEVAPWTFGPCIFFLVLASPISRSTLLERCCDATMPPDFACPSSNLTRPPTSEDHSKKILLRNRRKI